MNPNILDHDVIEKSFCGVEVEYAFVDSGGLPVSEIDGLPLIIALQNTINRKLHLKKIIKRNGTFKEEVFKHQIEAVTHKGGQEIVTNASLTLHDVLIQLMKEEFGLVASTEQPILYPGGGNTLITEKDYYQESMGKVDELGTLLGLVSNKTYYREAIERISQLTGEMPFARNASTTATHLHRSLPTSEQTFALRYALALKCSQDISNSSDSWFLKYGMSCERHEARSMIVGVREKLGEVMTIIDKPLFDKRSDDRRKQLADRYFDGDILSDADPKRDHRSRVIKKPSGYTVEGRTADGPGSDRDKIKTAVTMYADHAHAAIELFNTLQSSQGTKRKLYLL